MRTLVTLVLVCAFMPAVADAEKAPMSKEALTKVATHVVTGKVKAVYAREKVEGRWRVQRYVAEVEVASVEKGDGLEKGGLVYVRYWTRDWAGRGPQPPSTSGHVGLPKEGAKMRIYLARNAYDGFGETDDGGFNVIGGNGFEPLDG